MIRGLQGTCDIWKVIFVIW